MENFQSVGRQSLYYRLLPRILAASLLALMIIVVLSMAASFLHLGAYILWIMLIGFVFLAIVAVVTYITAYLEFSNLKYLIEDHALFLKEGVFEVDTETIPFQKIRNASFYQSLVQRLYKVGDIVIDQDPETYTWVGIDVQTAQTIMDAVSARSNIQPIMVEGSSPNPFSTPKPTGQN